MSVIHDSRTGFAMGDPEAGPFPGVIPAHSDIQKALDPMILSASGWRKVFAADGDEESTSGDLTPADTYLAAAMAFVFSDYLKEQCGKDAPLLVLGMDARYTGPAIGDAMLRVLIQKGVRVRHLFISAAPEIMGYTGQSAEVDGFIYISASHNPIGHNGVKFGLNTGGVLDGSQAGELIGRYRAFLGDPSRIPELASMADGASSAELSGIYEETARWKKEAEEVYRSFTGRVICGLEGEEQDGFFRDLRAGIAASPMGVVAELNGSARTLSIDRAFLEDQGIRVRVVNGTPRQITHRIVPEGASLNLCRETLETAHASDPAFQLGYVPDNDGDRGNLVYLNSRTGKAEILEAQEVFALSVLAELAYLDWSGLMNDRTGVAINGPTSQRIHDIAAAFGCRAFRAEVGEANAVNLAREKREEGWQIRILGEGSNGGNITFPAAVRDPLNTLGALLKLLTIRSREDRPGLFHLWCLRSGQENRYREEFDLGDVLATLPAYITTSAYEDRAIMRIRTVSHGELKARYEEVFAEEWEKRKDELKTRFGICRWDEWNQEGTSSVCGVGASFRSGAEKGGLSIRFYNEKDECLGFIWMRGSGTEPVFRVLTDWKGGDAEAEEFLLEWHKSMIRRADEA